MTKGVKVLEQQLRQLLIDLPYREYLQTEHWQLTRARAYARASHRCQVCNASSKLEAHHRTYVNRGCELDEDLVVLCRECHGVFHKHRSLSPDHRGTAAEELRDAEAALEEARRVEEKRLEAKDYRAYQDHQASKEMPWLFEVPFFAEKSHERRRWWRIARDREWSSETLRNFLGMVYHVYGKHIDNTLTPPLRKIIDANGKDPAAAFCAWCEPSKGEPA
jgi:hypothetical protein